MSRENFQNFFKLALIALAINVVATESQPEDISHQIQLLNLQLSQIQQKLELLDYFNASRAEQLSKDHSETPTHPPTNCVEAFDPLQGSGIYLISMPQLGLRQFAVYCMADPNDGQPWTVLQRRQDISTDFYRDWSDYKHGFGDLNRNFFIGLEKIHAWTYQGPMQELWVQIQDNETVNAYYDKFVIGNEADKYALQVLGSYSGDAGDSLSYHRNIKFSTRDSDNDPYNGECAKIYHGAWWYNKCHHSNLNGLYGSNEYGRGINWYHFRGDRISMKYSHMAIRPTTTL